MERKRKVTFNTNVESDQTAKRQKTTTNESRYTRLHNGNYTLDSDEEQDNSKTMNQDDLDGKLRRRKRLISLFLLFRNWTRTSNNCF
jgi:hypothetical protein